MLNSYQFYSVVWVNEIKKFPPKYCFKKDGLLFKYIDSVRHFYVNTLTVKNDITIQVLRKNAICA